MHEEGNGGERSDSPEKGSEENTPRDPLAEAVAEKDRVRDQLLRTAADFDNFRKRSRREIEEAKLRGRDDMFRELLPVVDNFERALVHAASGGDLGAVVDGLAMVQRLLQDTLDRGGVKVIDEVGVPFDPAIHDALQREETTEMPPGTVLRVVQKGYRSGDRLLRPASVVVAVGMDPDPATQNTG